jgi:poly(3-hydroxybutyrate) depolymerase
MDTSWSSDGFYYHPTDDVLDRFAAVNDCEGTAAIREYKTPKDGDMWWHCTEPHGSCKSGAAVVRCSSLAEHWWPTFLKRSVRPLLLLVVFV